MAVNKLLRLVAVLAAIFVASNRMLFGLSTGAVSEEYDSFIKNKDDSLNYYLEKHRKQIGDDFVPYRNHCLRVLAFSRYFLHQQKIQLEPRTWTSVILALAYHDIALWTDGALDYLDPSVAQMNKRVTEAIQQSKQQEGDEGTMYLPKNLDWSNFLEKESDIAKAIILQHHKLTSYDHAAASSNHQQQSGAAAGAAGAGGDAKEMEYINAVVNAVRKADWADATMGIVRFGLPQSILGAAYEAIPEAGFHKVLLNMGGRLSPESWVGQLDVLKIFKL